MTRHTLVKLAVGTAVAVVLALWASSSKSPVSEVAGAGSALVPGLSGALNDVTTLRVVEAGDKAVVTLQRVEDRWQVAERSGYAADIGKVRETLIRLADATLLEAKTANPERHSVLGVEDVAAATAKGTRVEIEGKVAAKIVVGTYSAQGGGSFFDLPLEAPPPDASNGLSKDGPAGCGCRLRGRDGGAFAWVLLPLALLARRRRLRAPHR